MGKAWPVSGFNASDPAAACGTGSTAGSGREWFPEAAQAVLGKDAGLHLHYLTGFPERSCYYYAAGKREPRVDFIRALVRSPQGEPFFNAIMSGCTAQWWLDLQRERRVGAAALREADK